MSKTVKQDSEFDFTASLEELEKLAQSLEGEAINLDQAIADYERGVELAKQLKDHLKQAENKIKTLKQRFDKED